MHKIKITNCKNHIEEFTLHNGTYRIGRSMDSTLRLEGEEVSRLHARLFVGQTRCELIDEASKNGTFVNGSRVSSHYLNDGDIIKIGRFNLQFISDSAKPHYPAQKRYVKLSFFIICLALALTLVLFLYQNKAAKKTKLQLAERTAQYLAERNKEALYLGEYNSINLSNLPPYVTEAKIWDRNGILRKDVQGRSLHTSGEISVPVYYESVQVGTLKMKYKL